MIVIPPPPPPTNAGESGFVSLRDYFAASAISGAVPARLESDPGWQQMAEWAYDLADFMLEARERKE